MNELKKIIYVEDQKDIQIIARVALEDIGGFELMICSSGEEALANAEGFKPDLFLLDVMMPGMDGPETLAALRKNPELENIPIMFMTAKVQTGEVARLLELGAVDVISKPFDPMTLADEIRKKWQQ